MELDISNITAAIGWVTLFGSMVLNFLQYKKTKSEARLNDTESIENITDSSIKLFEYYKKESLELRATVNCLRDTCESLQKEKVTLENTKRNVELENKILIEQIKKCEENNNELR